jgi:hypothetical protein
MLATATEHQAMPIAVKVLFVVVVLGMFVPVIYNILKDTTLRTPPKRTRKTKVKTPAISEARLRHMWVVDRERTNDDAGVTVYTRKDPK